VWACGASFGDPACCASSDPPSIVTTPDSERATFAYRQYSEIQGTDNKYFNISNCASPTSGRPHGRRRATKLEGGLLLLGKPALGGRGFSADTREAYRGLIIMGAKSKSSMVKYASARSVFVRLAKLSDTDQLIELNKSYRSV
jgi:hypothetical protein